MTNPIPSVRNVNGEIESPPTTTQLKVVQSSMYGTWMVVQSCYGEERTFPDGQKYTYEPIPLARIPDGFGRSPSEAEILALHIAALLMTHGLPS